MSALMHLRLLIVTQMEKPRAVEYLHEIGDHVPAHLVILWRGNHPVVFAEPRIVRSGEIELRYRLKPHRLESHDLLMQTVRAPAALDPKFGMAWIPYGLAKIDDHHVHPDLCHAICERTPHLLVKAQVVRLADEIYVFALVRTAPFVRNLVAPHVRAHME